MNGKAKTSYPESLLQWVWGNLQFNCTGLKTTTGLNIDIISPGDLNHASGPDFKNSEFYINGVRWYGSVEIHNDAKEWHEHGHHLDPAFNSVVLHVVLSRAHLRAETTRGSVPYTLHLRPYLHTSLAALLEKREVQGLPCGGNISYANQQAFEMQIESAHREYFDFKIQELLGAYQPKLVPSLAWKECLILQIYKTLGIPSNNTQMEVLYRKVSDKVYAYKEESEWVEYVCETAFLNQSSAIQWQTGGMRPASSPANRVRQAAAIQHALFHTPIKEILKSGTDIWKPVNLKISERFRTRGQRHEMLRTIVFLPAIYLLGKLFHAPNLMKSSYENWLTSARVVPSEVSYPFINAGFEITGAARKSGLAHQLKRYCSGHRCHQCEVFKSAIRS